MALANNGIFITFPVVSITNKEDGTRLIDRFDINAVAEHVVAVNGLDTVSEHATEGAQSTVHFSTETGMRAIISDATPEEILDLLNYDDFVSFRVVSVSDAETGERHIKRFIGFAKPEIIVGINALDGTHQQVTDDVRSIIYFKPASGLRPTLSSDLADDIIQRVNDIEYD